MHNHNEADPDRPDPLKFKHHIMDINSVDSYKIYPGKFINQIIGALKSPDEQPPLIEHDGTTFTITQRYTFQMKDNKGHTYEYALLYNDASLNMPKYWRAFPTHGFISWELYVQDKNDKSILNYFNIPNGIDVTKITVLQNLNHLVYFQKSSSNGNTLLKYGFYESDNVVPRKLVLATSNAEKCKHKIFESSFDTANSTAYICKNTRDQAIQTRQLLYGMIAYKDSGNLNIVKHDNGSETLYPKNFDQFMFTHLIEYKVQVKVEEAA